MQQSHQLFDQLIEISQQGLTQTVVERFADSPLEIHQNTDYLWLYHQKDKTIVSIKHKLYPERLAATYQHAMLLATLIESPRSIVNIGAGCGAFERWFEKHHQQLNLVSVEPSQQMADIAQKHFSLPSKTRYIAQLADEYVKQQTTKTDCYLIDIFDGGKHPSCLYQASFYQGLQQGLTERGTVAINLLPNDEQDLLQILLPARQVFSHSALVDLPESKNIVLLLTTNSWQQQVLINNADIFDNKYGTTTAQYAEKMLMLPSFED